MKKTWKLVVGIESFYLTEEEKDFYLESISRGAKFVQVSDKLLLGTNFQSLQHEQIIGERENIEEGKYKCKFGRWHTNGWNCLCGELSFDPSEQKYIHKGDTELTVS